MIRLGLALDDAALAIARRAGVPVVAPSIVDAGRGPAALAGRPAVATVRTNPTAASSRHWLDLATGSPPSRESLSIARAELAVRLADAANVTADVAQERAADEAQERAADEAQETRAVAEGEPAAARVAAVADADRGAPATATSADAGTDTTTDTGAVIAVPASFDGAALARVLAIARAVQLPVRAFVDSAALTVAALGLPAGATIVLELGLHHLAATRVDVDAREARRRSVRLRTRGGLVALQESWLQLVSEAMVLKTRFDPLHDAVTEQRLYDQLPAAAALAARAGSAPVGVAVGAGEAAIRHEVVLSRDQFAARGEALFRELVAMIHELRPAGAPVTLVAPARIAALPGLRESLAAEFAGCELLRVPDGFAAMAAARLPLDGVARGEVSAAVPLKRGVARFAEPILPAEGPVTGEWLGGSDGAAVELPTHLLWSGRALPLAGAAIEIGRAPAPGGIALAEGLAGVSRLHCTVRDEGGSVVLVDHSRHGSFVNGERVAGRARLRAGDRLRIGDPGVELALISVGGRHGTPQA